MHRLQLRLLSLVTAALVGFAAAPLEAQGRRPVPSAPRDMSAGEIQQLFDAMLLMQAQKVLALDETQLARFVPRLQNLQETRRRAQRERAQIIAELQRLSAQPAVEGSPESEAALVKSLDALKALDAQGHGELRRAYDAVDEVLTPWQRARFRVLEEQIERRKLDLISRARQAIERPAGRVPPRRPPDR
jgi:hypothetical protein